jgi:hypothetical protein
MKKTCIHIPLTAAFLLSACGPTGVTISGPAVITAVQGQGGCGIIIPIADIVALVAANPTMTSVDLVVNAICNAFKAQLAAAGGRTASPSGQLIVDGVLVHWTVKP